jgi:phosphate transport system permease protein
MGSTYMKSTQSLKKRLLKQTIFKCVIYTLSGLLVLPLLFIFFYIIKQGLPAFSLDFFTNLPVPVGELGGGISNAIMGSLLLLLIASLIAIPLGLLIGIYLSEHKQGRLSEITRLSIDTLQGIPSIVMGIIAYVWIVVPLGSFSVISGGFALSLIMLPVVTKSTEETLKLIPSTLKEGALALGAPYYLTMLKVILPTGKNSIISGILLGIARISGETAPLLFTAFGNPFMNLSLTRPVNSLPLLIFNYATSPYQEWQTLAWGASLLLVLFILGLSILSKMVVKR